MVVRLFLSSLFQEEVPPPDYTNTGIASTFTAHEKWNNGKFACGGDWEDPDRAVCAHRWLPCGTWIEVESKKTGRTAWCEVMDRGPYGALSSDGKWVLKRPRDPKTKSAKWRGIIDLSPSVTNAIGTGGFGVVTIRSWHKKKYVPWQFLQRNSTSVENSKSGSWRSWSRSMIFLSAPSTL